MEENTTPPENTQPKLPENPAVVKPTEAEAPKAQGIPTLPTANNGTAKVGPRPTTSLPRAKAPQISFAPKAAPIPPQPIGGETEKSGLISDSIDFIAAAVAVAFAVLTALDI